MFTIVGPKPKFGASVLRREHAGPVRERYGWQSSTEKALSVVSGRDPRLFPWGYFSKEQQESYIGMYLWFESLHEMLTYVAGVEPTLHEYDDTADKMARQLRAPLRLFPQGWPAVAPSVR